MEIIPSVKNYDWGKMGASSAVAQLASRNIDSFEIKDYITYSELWMGDHPSGPSVLKTTGMELGVSLPENLPYLFKVLSIRKALSIQVHPNKVEAIRLHNLRPDLYKDANHKPELAIALTQFVAMCGFRPYQEIYEFCQQLPSLKKLLGGDTLIQPLVSGGTHADMRKLFEKLMTAPTDETVECINDIGKNHIDVLTKYQLRDVFETLSKDYPSDVGVLTVFFLNLLRLNPGKAIFLPANEIHAYISGDCIECMACSDNVIRAGLTPKYKDLKQLLACLKYDGLPSKAKVFLPTRRDHHVRIFSPPVEDFAVVEIKLPIDTPEYKFCMQAYGSIMIVLKGERMLRTNVNYDLPLKRGSILFIPPEAAPQIEFYPPENVCLKEEFLAYIASCNYYMKSVTPTGCA